ncbi:MAG: TIGR03960 family B12-binding radical SAM protein [Nitrospiraceae bacterium]|nr:TIGR03960 family B12-binding radical SAM protein [Nitrospiraceae bacterium]
MKPEELFPLVRKPSRYLGTEINARHKDWGAVDLRMALIFPDLYEIGMSHLGLHILYHIVNEIPWALADRAYCPDLDLEGLLRTKKVPIWGLESRHPLSDFDVLGITLPYELCYSNILTILDLADIPILAEKRGDPGWPIILGGGTCSVNPEPIADLFDAILVGDGEEALPEILGIIRDWKGTGGNRDEVLTALSRVEGIYVPSFYIPRYLKDGTFTALEPKKPGIGTVRRRVVADLDRVPFPTRPLVPYMRIVHDRLGIEIARGCTRGCRFCQAGTMYRPVRERAPQKVLSIAEQALAASGWEELSLLSLSTGDYACLLPLLNTLMDRYMPRHIACSLPSLRVGTLTQEIMLQIQRVRKTGFTLAPEAGSERLRRVINKGITEEDLIETAAQAYGLGWRKIKLYFMIGLPTETSANVLEIARLANRVFAVGKGSRKTVVSVGTFVPKSHTPFQWEPQLSIKGSRERFGALRDHLRGRGLQFKWHDPHSSFLEGVFSRGDRRLTEVLYRAWEMGARLDAWNDRLRLDLYREAALEEGLDLERYLNAIDIDAPLPWDHISVGVGRNFLLKERQNAWKEVYTPDCRQGKCQSCGVCDFKRIHPVVHREFHGPFDHNITETDADRPVTYHLTFSKLGEARFLGHLEVVNALHRAAKRAQIPIAYSHGFHPKPRFSFGQPISLGIESLAEEITVTLTKYMRPDCLRAAFLKEMPSGIEIGPVEIIDTKTPLKRPNSIRYLIYVPDLTWSQVNGSIDRLNSIQTWPVKRIRKERVTETDLKQVLESLCPVTKRDIDRYEIPYPWPEDATNRGGTFLDLRLKSIERFNLKPTEVIGSVLGLSEEATKMVRILKY